MTKLFIGLLPSFLLLACTEEIPTQDLPDEWPRTCEAAVEKISKEVPAADLDTFKETPKDDLILYHHGFGTSIRNNMGLWGGNLELQEDCAELFPNDPEPWHPDSTSMMIITLLWQALNEE